jgi:hypothetical protein
MLRHLRRLVVTALSTLLLVGAFQVAADASGTPRVASVKVRGQNWCASTMRLTWKGVAGATYQVRWASAKARLRSAAPVTVRGRSVNAGPLAGGTSYFQVRALRHGRAGAWSAVRVGRFSSHWPGEPVLSGHGVANGVQFTWGCTQYASRYRVAWSAAPFGKWPETPSYVSGWLPQYARSSTFGVSAVPQSGDHMLGVAYANPVFGQLEAGNPSGGVRHSTGWEPVFPAPPDPGPGDPMRVGTYNVMLNPTDGSRLAAIAANINSHALGVVALQEANDGTAKALVRALGAGWAYVAPGNIAPQQILYRTDVFRAADSGSFYVPNPQTPSLPDLTPWVRLERLASGGQSQPVYVVSAHVTEDGNKSAMDRKRDAGIVAQVLMEGVGRANPAGSPVVLAGDLHYLREPYNDVPGYVEAPPTLVRGGYYDAMAALSKDNIAYQTFNGGNGTTAPRQAPAQSGVAGRSDYVMLKGFRSSNAYVNVANWSLNGLVPSDHNLVYADVTVPFAS